MAQHLTEGIGVKEARFQEERAVTSTRRRLSPCSAWAREDTTKMNAATRSIASQSENSQVVPQRT